MMDRSHVAERNLTSIAAGAAGLVGPDPDTPHPSVKSLDDYADHRALPGPVRTQGRDLMLEAAEELSDCRNYLLWRALQVRAAFEAGDADAAEVWARSMRALAFVQRAWDSLYG